MRGERPCQFPGCGDIFAPPNPNSNVKYCPKHPGGRASDKPSDPKVDLSAEQLERLSGFLQARSPIPPIPDKVRATRIEEMGFDSLQQAVALFSDLHYYCVAPTTRILTRDLQWVPAGDLKSGDQIIGFDESPSGFHRENWPVRRYQPATIQIAERRLLPTYAIHLSTGERLVATGEHRWLATYYKTARKTQWYRTDALARPKSGGHRPYLLRYIRPWDNSQYTYDEGFLAAAFDGEGCLTQHKGGALGWPTLHMGQRPNAFLLAVESALDREGFPYSLSHNEKSGVSSLHLTGGKETTLRFLGQVRPPRLLEKWNTTDLSQRRLDSVEAVQIERVEYLGEQEVAVLASSSETYIAEGFAAHNSKIDRRVTGGLGEYNIDIARERLARWRDGLLRFTQMSQLIFSVDTLHLFALGDELEGTGRMFPTQALQMSEPMLFQVMGFVEDMTRIILDFLTRYKKVVIYKVPGNHGRLASRAREAYTPDNAELFAWEIIGERLRNAAGGEWKETANGIHSLEGGLIDLHIHRSFFTAVRIFNWLCVGRHGSGVGDLMRTYTGAFDVKLRMNSLMGEIIHYYFQGHHHEPQAAEKEIQGEVIQNGCFVGPSLLAIERSRPEAGLPSQELLFLHPKYGKTHHHRIHLATADEVRHLEVIGGKGE